MRGTTLFQWPWRCTTHLNVIWIISLVNVLIFSMIDNWEVIYPYLFTFNYSRVIIVLLCVLAFAIEEKIVLVGDVCFRPPITIKSPNLHVGEI